MTLFLCIVCIIIGFAWGRIYGWMKYHYPEFQERIKLNVAKTRAERMRYEAEAERSRGEIDDDLDRRLSR